MSGDEAFLAAQRRYPSVQLPEAAFLARLAAHPDATDRDDLFLAAACLAGDTAALKQLDALLLSVAPLIGRSSSVPVDEVLQVVRVRLVMGTGGAPRLRDYAGRGSLVSWIKTIVVHTSVSLARRLKPNEPIDSLAMLELPDEREWPEASVARSEARTRLRDALERALTRLSRKERTLLRQHYLDGLTLEELAAYLRVHRATVARWLAAAREALLAALEAEACCARPVVGSLRPIAQASPTATSSPRT